MTTKQTEAFNRMVAFGEKYNKRLERAYEERNGPVHDQGDYERLKRAQAQRYQPPMPKGPAPSTELTPQRKRALKLRAEGMFFCDIGDIMGVSTARAWQLYKAALRDLQRLHVVHEQEALREQRGD